MADRFDPLVGLFAGDQRRQPNPAFADRLRRRVLAIEQRVVNDRNDQPHTGQDRDEERPDNNRSDNNRTDNNRSDEDSGKEADMNQPKLIPYLTASDGRAAIEFYKEVLGAELIDDEYFEMDDGRLGHASLRIGDGVMYVSDEFPEMGVVSPTTLGGGTVAIVINVADADATYNHAVAAGATAQRPVENQHGGRSGWFVDPWGHRWSPFGPEKPDS